MTTKIKYGLKMRLDKNLVVSRVPLFSNNMTYTFSNYFYQLKNNDYRLKIQYRGCVGTGSGGSTEPFNFKRGVLEPVNFGEYLIKSRYFGTLMVQI